MSSAFRVAVTSDLHLPITPSAKVAALAQEIAEYDANVLAVAGDIGESLPEIARCLEILRRRLVCPILVIAGNHDLWSRSAGSRRLWEELLPMTVQQEGCIWLEGDAFIRNGIAVAGTIAWYDYSAADPGIQAAPENFAASKRFFNMDAEFINWEWSDVQFAALVPERHLATLDRLENDPDVRQTIVVTHVPLLECQMCRRPDNPDWAFSNAYFGNLTLGRQVLTRKKVTHIISGHTHVGRKGQVQLEGGRIVTAEVLASEYDEPVWLGLDLDV